MTKPFSTRELIARVKANLRRHYSQPAQEVNDTSNEIVIKDIVIYPDAYSIKKRGDDIELTPMSLMTISFDVSFTSCAGCE